jgi:hypothetical protein
MFTSWMRRRFWLIALGIVVAMPLGLAKADLDPAAVTFTKPDQIKWTGTGGNRNATLLGDPAKPGLYIILIKWMPHNMSRPHWHSTDRYATVLSGTWWVGSGTKYDPESTVPMPAGSFVTDLAKGVHYDGAKDEETVIEIVGQGPVATTQAEAK